MVSASAAAPTALGNVLPWPGASETVTSLVPLPVYVNVVRSLLCFASSPCTQLFVERVSAPSLKVPVTSAGPMSSLIEYDAPAMPGMASAMRTMAFTFASASDQNSFLWRTNVIVSTLFWMDTPTSPLPRSGALVV